MSTITYKEVLKTEKQFTFMIMANVISRFGDSIDAIAYSWLIYQMTGSKSWLALVLGINMIPTVLLQPLGGGLTEFLNKKAVVVVCDLIRGGIVCTTALFMIAGILRPWHLLVLTFMNSTIEALRIPNGLAIIPHILSKENYKTAISLNQGASRTAELVGMGCAGVVIGTLGAGGALLVDAGTFIISGLLLSFLKIQEKQEKKQNFHFKKYLVSLKDGALYLKENRWASMVCITCILLNVTAIPIENLQAAYVSEFLKLGVTAMSAGSTAMTIGMISGSFAVPWVSKKMSDRHVLFAGGLMIGILYFVYIFISFIPSIWGKYLGYMITAFIFGFVNSLIGVVVNILFMTRVPDSLLGRVGSLFTALACSCIPVTSFILASVGESFSIGQIYALTGILSVISFVMISRSTGVEK
ncbi:MFS transporter [Hungatella hathewayi]|uniref:MFS transporter n=1 Tax=Hungatella hathewayi TaxID=154046 RepID=UPI003567D0A8